jgi:peptide/nickel transport system ATP-binding protein
MERGESLAIVGESGSGKSLTALSVLGLLPKNTNVRGSILFEDTDICSMTRKELQRVRGKKIAMVFQEPMTSLNPVFPVGEQLVETIVAHESVSRRQAKQDSVALLEEVGISSTRFHAYPHEFSGGMRQRIVIAIALACKPTLLIADEPTTALDASTSMQIVSLLQTLQKKRGMATLFITHDLCLVPAIADRVCVMRSGKIIEQGETNTVLRTPSHTYTKALIACVPTLDTKRERLCTVQDVY